MARVARHRFALQCLAVAALAALLRLPFLGSIGPDEGGYAYAAWQWASGRGLYRSVWIDRPQGLLLAYRGLIGIALEPWAIRLGALVAAVAIALLLVAVGTELISRRAGVLAGLLFAAVGVGPRIEGFTFNGELAAAAPATAAVAVALRARKAASPLLYLVAGVLAGSALLMKQSGFDGLAVAGALALTAPCRRRASTGCVVAGALVPVAASAVAGWRDDWPAYWSGVVWSHAVAVPVDRRLRHLGATASAPLRDLLVLAVVAALGLVVARRLPLARLVLPVWVVAAVVAVNLGGLYWPHYYVQLVPPLALAAAAALVRLPPVPTWLVAAAVAAPALYFVAHVSLASPTRRAHLVRYALAFENDRRIGRYVRAHSSRDDRIYALISRADVYFLARRRAAFRYLWVHPLRETRSARDALVSTLSSPGRPRLVVVFQHPKHDAFGRRVSAALAAGYRIAWRAPVTGTPVLESTAHR